MLCQGSDLSQSAYRTIRSLRGERVQGRRHDGARVSRCSPDCKTRAHPQPPFMPGMLLLHYGWIALNKKSSQQFPN